MFTRNPDTNPSVTGTHNEHTITGVTTSMGHRNHRAGHRQQDNRQSKKERSMSDKYAEISKEIGRLEERARLIKLLKQYGVLRDSMLGPDWYVIATERGSMDITRDRLEGNE
jgi:hypothetical protein